jgi:hypothetical protein
MPAERARVIRFEYDKCSLPSKLPPAAAARGSAHKRWVKFRSGSRNGCASAKKLATVAIEFQAYITNNTAFSPNSGEKYRNGEAISSAVAESMVNQVVSRRMIKQQQMQWTPEGAPAC